MELVGPRAHAKTWLRRALLLGFAVAMSGVPIGPGASAVAAEATHAPPHLRVTGSAIGHTGAVRTHHATSTHAPVRELSMSAEFRTGLTFSVGLIVIGGVGLFLVTRRRR